MVYISNESLWWVYKLLELDTEACGILEEHGDELRLVLDNIGEEKDGRKLCNYTRYGKYIWHTHPRSAKGYPSSEDIAKTLKHSSIHGQFIFTTWGIWELHTTKHHVPSPGTIKAIANEANGLYHLTERGKVLTKHNAHALRSYIDGLMYNLSSYGLNISFVSWEELGGSSNYMVRF